MNIALYTDDITYGKMLFDYVNKYYKNRINLSLITEKQYFKDHINRIALDILIIDNISIDEDIESMPFQIMYLSDDSNREFCDINKYQPADQLVNEIISLYGDDRIAIKSKATPSTSIVFYSPQGGSGVTSATIATGIYLSSKNNKVLYISLEDIDSTGYYFEIDELSHNDLLKIDDLVCDKNIDIKIDNYINTDSITGIDYLKNPIAAQYLYELSFKDLQVILGAFYSTGMYEYILIDLSSNIGIRNLEIMKYCDKLMLIKSSGEMHAHKYSKLLKEIRLIGDHIGINLEDKFKIVNLNNINPLLHSKELSINREFVSTIDRALR